MKFVKPQKEESTTDPVWTLDLPSDNAYLDSLWGSRYSGWISKFIAKDLGSTAPVVIEDVEFQVPVEEVTLEYRFAIPTCVNLPDGRELLPTEESRRLGILRFPVDKDVDPQKVVESLSTANEEDIVRFVETIDVVTVNANKAPVFGFKVYESTQAFKSQLRKDYILDESKEKLLKYLVKAENEQREIYSKQVRNRILEQSPDYWGLLKKVVKKEISAKEAETLSLGVIYPGI